MINKNNPRDHVLGSYNFFLINSIPLLPGSPPGPSSPLGPIGPSFPGGQ